MKRMETKEQVRQFKVHQYLESADENLVRVYDNLTNEEAQYYYDAILAIRTKINEIQNLIFKL